MTDIKLSEIETRAIDAAITGDLSDPVSLMRNAGCDVATFFEFGDWRGADFRSSDLVGVSFRGADLREALVTEEQYFVVLATQPSFPPATPTEEDLEQHDLEQTSFKREVFNFRGGDKSEPEVITVEDLVQKTLAYNQNSDSALIRRAYQFGEEMHEGQMRHSGEPYFSHPVTVASILTDLRLSDEVIAAGLLHDVVEDTQATYSQVEQRFGAQVAGLVDDVTRLTNLQHTGPNVGISENYPKIVLQSIRDLRSLSIKLADRLHNLRTISPIHPAKRMAKAVETLDIYAWIARQTGPLAIQEELEDLCFKLVNPSARTAIIRRCLKLQEDESALVDQIGKNISGMLNRELSLDSSILAQCKEPYTIWRESRDGISLGNILDAYRFIVTVPTEEGGRAILDVLRQEWSEIPSGFKDYFSQPKSNGYSALHSRFHIGSRQSVEVQILTESMIEYTSDGVFTVLDGDGLAPQSASIFPGVDDFLTGAVRESEERDELMDLAFLKEGSSDGELIFCFTPMGEIVKLPRGSTPLDFAFHVHTKLGEECVGAKVDGMRVPLWTRLVNGQAVEIVRAEGQVPQEAWLESLASPKARRKLRRALRLLG